MLEEDVLLSPATARKLRIISRNPILRSHVNALPAHYGTLYELCSLKENTLGALIEDGTITPKMERDEARKLRAPPIRSLGHQQCAVCADTARVPEGHRWSEEDDVEDQGNTLDVVEKLTSEIDNIFGRLRPNIERVIDERVHPDIRAVLADALREHASMAIGLADRLSPDQ